MGLRTWVLSDHMYESKFCRLPFLSFPRRVIPLFLVFVYGPHPSLLLSCLYSFLPYFFFFFFFLLFPPSKSLTHYLLQVRNLSARPVCVMYICGGRVPLTDTLCVLQLGLGLSRGASFSSPGTYVRELGLVVYRSETRLLRRTNACMHVTGFRSRPPPRSGPDFPSS